MANNYKVTVYKKMADQKRFVKIKDCKNYIFAWRYVADALIKLDYRLHLGYTLQYLGDGYTGKRVFPFGTTEIKRKGVIFRIKI